ncbi:MAG: hypothetical protein ACTSSE_11925 [Candidatus Thorarchaeota archaeon]
MLNKTVEDIIRKEIVTVRARRTILDHLEGGLHTGAELREKISTDIKGQMVKEGASKRDIEKVKVTSPKLYHNTKRLEELGIIVSWKQSQYRLFELEPRAIHPVRRALYSVGAIDQPKPMLYVTSLSNPEDQLPFVQWIRNTLPEIVEREITEKEDMRLWKPRYLPSKLLVFVEALHWSRGVSRIGGRFIPDDEFRERTTEWIQIPDDITGADDEREYGNLQRTYEYIENVVLDHIQDFNLVFDLTLGPTLATLAMAKIAHEYSTEAFRVSRYDTSDAEISYY